MRGPVIVLAQTSPGGDDMLICENSFYATMLHPVFFTSGAIRFVEVVTNEQTGEYYNAVGKVIREYREKAPWRGVAVNSQPAFQVRCVEAVT